MKILIWFILNIFYKFIWVILSLFESHMYIYNCDSQQILNVKGNHYSLLQTGVAFYDLHFKGFSLFNTNICYKKALWHYQIVFQRSMRSV
jgi:hypothetical protein